jgi:adenylosuccinate synthase
MQSNKLVVDVIVGLQYGDEGKGKVTHHLLKNGDYTHCLRYNGGCNAGHTIYHEGKKYVTHHIPAGVFFGIESIIGPGCVVNRDQFLKEVEALEESGFDPTGIHIDQGAHVITEQHIEEEEREAKLGTTKRGNGPAYRDKYGRNGVRAASVDEFVPYLIDLYSELHENYRDVYVLCEGAQGFGLDIDWGDYPYVTSSHCTTAGALLNGIPWRSVRHVYGVIKAYETYVGSKNFDSGARINDKIRSLGQEYGATTGRPRQINWLDLDFVEKAAKVNGITHLIINKMDILRDLGHWALIHDGNLQTFNAEKEIEEYIRTRSFLRDIEVIFSSSPETV